MLICMQSTSIRVDRETHDAIKRLAVTLGRTVGDTVALAVRRFRQEQLGRELAIEPTPAEAAWLDAELG